MQLRVVTKKLSKLVRVLILFQMMLTLRLFYLLLVVKFLLLLREQNFYARRVSVYVSYLFLVKEHSVRKVKNIKKQFAYEKGVKDVRVNQAKQQVTVTYNPTKTDTKRMIAAFKEIGKDATVATPPEVIN